MIPVFNDGVRFDCTPCGRCCASLKFPIPLFVRDVRTISRYLGLSVERFLDGYCVHLVDVVQTPDGSVEIPSIALRVPDSGRCVFLDDANRCRIHAAKPFVCAQSPFLRIVAEDESLWREGASYCPGVGVGPRFSRSAILSLLQEEDAREEEDLELIRANGGDLEAVLQARLPQPVIRQQRLSPAAPVKKRRSRDVSRAQ